jgi:myo-inositol-1(or 4)-monophosphatase
MLSIAIEAAREAGRILQGFRGRAYEIETKHDQTFNLVTAADKAAERAIIEVIHRHHPDHQILGEEGGAVTTRSEYKWIIDPLDGTTNFTHAFPIYSVSIAVEYKGEVIAGVVFDPSANELFHAEKGAGAFMNDTRLHVSSVEDLSRAMLVTGFPYNVQENPNWCHERFIAFLMNAQAIRRLGSAALDCAYVAAGRLDGYWEVALQPWDKAAGQLLVTEAGGTISNFEGGPHSTYDPPFLGSNGLIHHRMVDILTAAKTMRIEYAAGDTPR